MEHFNEFLRKFGNTPLGQPWYRLVWSDNELEIRHGTFNEFTTSGLFLRTVVDTRETPKYSYIKSRWILEKWIPPDKSYTPELPNSRNGSFEPLFVFEDRFGHPLEITYKALEFIIGANNQVRQVYTDRSQEIEDKEIAYFKDAIDSSPIQNALHLRQGVGYGSR
jgi:hypothetical protein